MTHGVQLCPRWNGIGSPPIITAPLFTGTPSLEVTHPFHFKMTPSMLLGPKCNHDLGILLRLVDASAPSTDIEQVRGSPLMQSVIMSSTAHLIQVKSNPTWKAFLRR